MGQAAQLRPDLCGTRLRTVHSRHTGQVSRSLQENDTGVLWTSKCSVFKFCEFVKIKVWTIINLLTSVYNF